ncbi:hypothetical protein FGO68_gene14021 [Halteria grandinella]|uniref:Uncharacterized protein n=1 Tax=Halteria grandinella TaxID=5974 RepID=A0A8J8SU88_HALGN|nr:hypothetical protein FGO68_gene14021 [Halteria grandinella]
MMQKQLNNFMRNAMKRNCTQIYLQLQTRNSSLRKSKRISDNKNGPSLAQQFICILILMPFQSQFHYLLFFYGVTMRKIRRHYQIHDSNQLARHCWLLIVCKLRPFQYCWNSCLTKNRFLAKITENGRMKTRNSDQKYIIIMVAAFSFGTSEQRPPPKVEQAPGVGVSKSHYLGLQPRQISKLETPLVEVNQSVKLGSEQAQGINNKCFINLDQDNMSRHKRQWYYFI